MKIQQNITHLGIVLATVFWIVDAYLDSLLSVEGISFLESCLNPDAIDLWVRCFVILLFLIFCAHVEKLLKITNGITRKLRHYHNTLEHTVNELKKEASERKRAIEKLEIISITDPLTSLINRRKFHEILIYELEKNQRYQSGLSLIMCDIDHFKEINDQFGHDVGDDALKLFSETITENIREVDTVSRWGGEEFLILMPNVDLKKATSVAEKLRKVIELTNIGKINSLTASFGVTHHKANDTVESFIKRVDDALYIAKGNGRNMVESI